MKQSVAIFKISLGAIIVALLSTSAGAVKLENHPGTRHHAFQQPVSATNKPSKKPPISSPPYLINGIFLTDLRNRDSFSHGRTAPDIARKYPRVDMLVTVVADGKVILSPRAIRLKLPQQRVKLPERLETDAFVDMIAFSPDGTHTVARIYHGPILNSAYSTYRDLCVVNFASGKVHRLTRDKYLEGEKWSPDYRQIMSVEYLDQPAVPGSPRHSRLVVIDAKTGMLQTLSDRQTEKNGTLQRYFWAKSKTGERGVVFLINNAAGELQGNVGEIEAHRTYAWFFVPVPTKGDAKPQSIRQIIESDLPDYGVSTFPSAVIKAQHQLEYELKSSSPQNDMAEFHRDDSGLVDDGSGTGPEGLYTPWIVTEAGRWAIVDATGKVLLDYDEKEIKYFWDWTWDGILLIPQNDDVDIRNKYFALNPRTPNMMRPAIVPPKVPVPWEQWIQLSPVQARRAAAQWRHLPRH